MSNNRRDNGHLDSTGILSRGSRSPRTGSGASASGVHQPNTPTSRALQRPIGPLPAGHRPPEETGRKLRGLMTQLNDTLQVVNRLMWAEVETRRTRASTITEEAETYAEVQRAEELCEEFAYLARRLLRLANWPPSERALHFRESGGRA